MSRIEEIIAALLVLGNSKSLIDLASLRYQIERNWSESLPNTWEVTARQVLRTLQAVNLIQIYGDQIQPSYRFLNSQFSDADNKLLDNEPALVDRSDSPANGGSDGGGEGGTPPNGGDQNGENSGDGFREVLGHPYLFSLPEVEFNEILESI